VFCGIDIGSRAVKIVLFDGAELRKEKVIETAHFYKNCGVHTQAGFVVDFAGLLAEEPTEIAVTGYGRNSLNIVGAEILSELKAHMLGAVWQTGLEDFTLLDLGGQDSKVIRLAEDGRVEDFAMNDKCAAGTGRFLEVMARSLDTDLQSLGMLSALSNTDVRISSTCTVFAESEVVALVAKGAAKEDIIRGLHKSVAERVYAMVARLRAEAPFVMTGGVAKNSGVVAALEERLNAKLLVPEEPQIVGALGAAIVAGRGD